jgi:hypothetical protein
MIKRLLSGNRSRTGLAPALLMPLLLTWALAAPAQADNPAVAGLFVDPGFSQAGFQNLHYEFEQCGSAHELTCTWEVRAIVETAGDKECDPSAPATTVWSSGEQSGNGSVDSGPQSFGLLGCKGQYLVLSYEFDKTFGNWGDDPVPPLLITGGRSAYLLAHLGYEPLAETEQMVIDESPAAKPAAMPEPPTRLAVSPGCRTATLGSTRFAFKFKRIGCWKASLIAAAAQRSGTAAGYRCQRRLDGGGRCVRVGQPRKFVEWHLPRRQSR